MFRSRIARIPGIALLKPAIFRQCRSQNTAFQFHSYTTSAKQPNYTTITVTSDDDIAKLYPLLLSYADNPARANALRKITVDTEFWAKYYSWKLPGFDPSLAQEGGDYSDLKRTNRDTGHGAHSFLERHVTSLGLGDHLTRLIVDSLAWKKQRWLGHVPDDTKDFSCHEKAFAASALVLLFSLCDNLTVLRMNEVPEIVEEYLLKNNYGQLDRPGLQSLQTFEFLKDTHLDFEPIIFRGCFRFVGRLPAMENLVTNGLEEHEFFDMVFPGTSNIKNVHLGHGNISAWSLSMCIRAPKVLEELRVSMGGVFMPDGGHIIPGELTGKSLLQHKNTLRTLDLDIVFDQRMSLDYYRSLDYGEYAFEDLSEKGDVYVKLDKASGTIPLLLAEIPDDRPYGLTIGSLHDFNALTHLSIGLHALLGPLYHFQEPPFRLIDALPPRLEYLCLYGYEKGLNKQVDDHVEEFMQHKERRLPRLVEIHGVDKTVMGIAISHEMNENVDEWCRWPESTMGWIEE
ncbi:hypothetical protein FGRMN_4026 [Fusarium graminum]|nr:hypothetical protein FGRMN_4026 [Fusarium graminum]